MRSRDEVLREFGLDPRWVGSAVRVMADRLRELESQQAASEPVAVGNDGLEWPQTFDGMAWAVEFNKRFPAVPVGDALGWFCNAIMRGYDTHAQKHAHPSAAAVTVTEAMVRAACEEFTRQYGRDERLDADVAKAVLTAALTAASEGASEASAHLNALTQKIAQEAYEHWDADRDSKVGKLLRALGGEMGIRLDLDNARAALTAASERREEGNA